MQKTLLLTGGAGYIGSHTAVTLALAGYRIVIVDSLVNSDTDSIDAIERITGFRPVFIEGDIRDAEVMEYVFESYRPDSVVHLAGLKSVGESIEKPFEYYDNNIRGSLVLFETMERHNVRNIVFSSSATVYSEDNVMPLTEDSRLGTTNPYGTTKLVIEQFLRDLVRAKGWKVACLRYFNPIGAHTSGLLGENPRGTPANLLPYLLDVATGKRPEVLVYGDDYPTPDGTGVRDYIHIDDLARGHVAACAWLDSLDDTGRYETINLGTGTGTSVMEMVAMVADVAGHDIPHRIASRRAGDIATVYCSADKALSLLGWRPEKTVREAVEDAYRYAVWAQKSN